MERYIKSDWVDFETVITEELMDKIEDQLELVTDEAILLEEQINDIQLTPGPQGAAGHDGNSVELRKSESSIEWRQTTNKVLTADFNQKYSIMTVNEDDNISRIVLSDLPKEVKYAQIKTITVYGADDNGRDIVNSNPSINTAPPGVTFPEFGGFDPVTSGPVNVSFNSDIVGNASIKKIIETYVESLSEYHPEITRINKIDFWVYFLDAEKKEIKFTEVICRIKYNTAAVKTINEWNELVDISELAGKSAYELAVEDGFEGTLTEWLESLKANYDNEIAELNKKIAKLEEAINQPQ